MAWNEAHNLIIENILIGTDLNTENSTFRFVLQEPPYPCTRQEFLGLPGFKVKIGLTSCIDVPMLMLKSIYEQSIVNNQIYNHEVFNHLYPQILKVKGCYVHVVGMIFLVSGVAILQHGNYEIIL